MFETANGLQSLSRGQRVRLGSVAMVVGIALIGALGLISIPSAALRVVIGTVGVLVMVAGVLLVGTSEGAV